MHSGNNLNLQRMTAQFKKVVIHIHLCNAQNLAPNAGQGLFFICARQGWADGGETGGVRFSLYYFLLLPFFKNQLPFLAIHQ